jgi:hypothetical protein
MTLIILEDDYAPNVAVGGPDTFSLRLLVSCLP